MCVESWKYSWILAIAYKSISVTLMLSQNKKNISLIMNISNLIYCRLKQQIEYEIWPPRFGSFDTCFSLWES